MLGNSICFFLCLDRYLGKKRLDPKKVTSPKTNDSKVRKFKILNPKMEVGGGWKMIFFSVSKKGLCFFFRFQLFIFRGQKCRPLRMQFEDGAVPSMPSGMATSAAASLGVAGSTPLAQCSLVWKPKGKTSTFKNFS